jgi:hypothetical protein
VRHAADPAPFEVVDPMVEIDVLLVEELFGVLRICKACKRSRRLIEKWRDAAAMINIAAKKQP